MATVSIPEVIPSKSPQIANHIFSQIPGASKGDPTIIYEHLIQLCAYRGATVTSRVDPSQFIATMESNHYTKITADRPADDIRGAAHIVVVQFSTYHLIDATSAKFESFLERIIKDRPKDDIEYNIILVTSAPVTPAILRIIANKNKSNVVVEQFSASMVLIVVPEHSCVPHHSIVSREEINRLCREMHMMVNQLPCIMARDPPDPMAVWLGLRPGMIVQIDRPSETSGIETIYRRCV